MSDTARNFALQLGSLIALYISLAAAIAVIFAVITIAFPDAAEGYWAYDSAQSGIRFGIASLIVFFPAYLVLTRLSNKARRSDKGSYTKVTKWLVYLSLVVGGGILLGDLVAVIMTYLNGELTTRFVFKALALFVVINAASSYYVKDVRGYWDKHEKQSIFYGAVATLCVLIVLGFGFSYSDSPSQVREMRIDTEQVNDLQSIEWRIYEYYDVNGVLPETMEAAFRGLEVPEARDGRTAYEYRVVDGTTYELCATFAYPSRGDMSHGSYVAIDGMKAVQSWDHGEGETCFERVVE